MKRQILFLFIALVSVTLYSCDSDDDDLKISSVPVETRNAFTSMYPSANKVDWDNEGGYYIAEFYENNIELSAWFDSNGLWYMTEHDIPYSALPEAVKTAFKASEYASWKVDDVDMLERKDMETVYIIEAENQNQEVDLYYSAEGILIKSVVNGSGSHAPQVTPSEIEAFIKEKYPQARIIEIESEKGMIEVDIIHENISKDVYFNMQNTWLSTSWDIRGYALPGAITMAIANNPSYAGYRIDDAEYVETPNGDYYLIELEKGNSEIKVRFDASGNILS